MKPFVPAVLRLAVRNVERQRGRSGFTLVSIIFGVAALILSGGFIEDTIVEVGESLIHSESGHLQVSRLGYAEHGAHAPERYLIQEPERLRASLVSQSGAADVMLRLGFGGLLSNGRADVPIVGEGVEPAREAKLGTYLSIAQGRALAPTDSYGAMIGMGVARALGVRPGDSLTLLANTVGGATNSIELTVVGVFQTFSKDFDARAVRIRLQDAHELLGTKGAHVAVIALGETGETDRIAQTLRRALDPKAFEVRTWVELNDFYTQTIALYQQQFGFLVGVVLLMLVLGVSNTVHMNVYERASEFGTMQALGDRPGKVFVLILTEGAVLGAMGSLVGLIVGAALAVVISAVGIPMPPPPNADLGYTSKILVVPWTLALSFSIGTLAAIVASVGPARRVSRMPIAESLRYGV